MVKGEVGGDGNCARRLAAGLASLPRTSTSRYEDLPRRSMRKLYVIVWPAGAPSALCVPSRARCHRMAMLLASRASSAGTVRTTVKACSRSFFFIASSRLIELAIGVCSLCF